jgi:hypothetical protein
MDARIGWHRVGLAGGRDVSISGRSVLFSFQSVDALGSALAIAAAAPLQPEAEIIVNAPRSAPLRTDLKPGAETALFLYHRYFPGAQRPDGERM